MAPSAAQLPTRTFAAGFFAIVALGTATVLTPFVVSLLESYQKASALPFFASACAYGWAWLLHPGDRAEVYGKWRGALVALLAYLTFTGVLAVYLHWVMPARPDFPHHREALLLLAAFVLTPFPWLVLMAGAAAGRVNLRKVRRCLAACVASSRRTGSALVALLRTAHGWLRARAADPNASAAVAAIVSSCLLFAGAALGLAWLHPAHGFSDEGIDLSQRLLPGTVALMLAVGGWACGRALLAITPAARRLDLVAMSSVLAGAAAVWFSVAVVQ